MSKAVTAVRVGGTHDDTGRGSLGSWWSHERTHRLPRGRRAVLRSDFESDSSTPDVSGMEPDRCSVEASCTEKGLGEQCDTGERYHRRDGSRRCSGRSSRCPWSVDHTALRLTAVPFLRKSLPLVGIESVELTWTRVWEDFSGIGYRFRGGGLVGFGYRSGPAVKCPLRTDVSM